MSLFSTSDLTNSTKERPKAPAGFSSSSENAFYLGETGKSIKTAIPTIEDGKTYHVPCFVNWSLHDVLAHLLHFTGAADVCLTSWAISEEPVRKIMQLRQDGSIRTLNCVFDERVRRYCPAAMQMADGNLGTVKLTGIHAKILVIENDVWGISVTSTANATNKKRIEKYVICCDKAVAEFDRLWILKIIHDEKPFTAV